MKYIKYTFIDQGGMSGPVTSFSRDAQEGETQKQIDSSFLVWGYDPRAYEVVSQTFTALPEEEVLDMWEKDDAQSTADAVYEEELGEPVSVEIKNVTYWFTAGWDNSQLIDSKVQLAENLNTPQVILWDHWGEPHEFQKNDAKDVAAAVASSYHDGYDAWMQEKKDIRDS